MQIYIWTHGIAQIFLILLQPQKGLPQDTQMKNVKKEIDLEADPD